MKLRRWEAVAVLLVGQRQATVTRHRYFTKQAAWQAVRRLAGSPRIAAEIEDMKRDGIPVRLALHVQRRDD